MNSAAAGSAVGTADAPPSLSAGSGVAAAEPFGVASWEGDARSGPGPPCIEQPHRSSRNHTNVGLIAWGLPLTRVCTAQIAVHPIVLSQQICVRVRQQAHPCEVRELFGWRLRVYGATVAGERRRSSSPVDSTVLSRNSLHLGVAIGTRPSCRAPASSGTATRISRCAAADCAGRDTAGVPAAAA